MIIAEAYRDAQKIKGEGDAKASALYADAFGRDPQFAQFYRSLEAYRASFRNKSDVMVLDPSSDFFQRHARQRRRRRRRRRRSRRPCRADAGDLLLGALALMLVIEGLLPFLSPRAWRSVFERATQLSDGQIRFIGLCSMLAGLLLLASSGA